MAAAAAAGIRREITVIASPHGDVGASSRYLSKSASK